ncbi:MAG: hypothetical protein ACYDCL_14970 [Myxococcales bacterium]
MKTPLVSWKRQPPRSPAEAKAARLLRELGPAPTLPPEAHARINQTLRGSPPRKTRLTLWPPMRISVIASGLASMAIVGALVLVIFDQKTARQGLLEEAPAAQRRKASSAPKATPETERMAAAHASMKRLGEAPSAPLEGREASAGGSPHAVPPPGWNPSPARKAGVAEPSRAAADRAVTLPAHRRNAPPISVPAAATAAAPVPPAAFDKAAAGRDDPGEICRRFGPGSAVERQSSDLLSQAELMLRARCRLAHGDRAGGRNDLEAYLARFPDGQFAAQAEQKLGDLGK